MIAFLHGYLLEGSGSNVWTRSMVESLCRQGETVHLICQEGQPERYPFISEAMVYHPDGRKDVVLQRRAIYAGTCILHKPLLGRMLPVYVPDRYTEFTDVRPMVTLSDDQIEAYLHQNQQVLHQILRDHPIRAIHANHAVLMSVVAQRVARSDGISYAITPHGSAIEYAVKRDQRFYRYAEQAFRDAQRIYALSTEMADRVASLFPDLPDLEHKICLLNTGVDTRLFAPLPPHQGAASLHRLYDTIQPQQQAAPDSAHIVQQLTDRVRHSAGCTDPVSQFSDWLRADRRNEPDLSEIATWLQQTGYGQAKIPDVDNLRRLTDTAITQEKNLIFVGRLIANKGLYTLLTALPGILSLHPGTRLIIVGHGPQRAVLESLVCALSAGDADLFCQLLCLGLEMEGQEMAAFSPVAAYLEQETWVKYVAMAQQYLSPDRVIFTGYLEHTALCHLFPVCDVAIFPSVLAEAAPLVFLEAMASGCFPIGTDFAGMAACIQAAASVLPADIGNIMRLRPDPAHTVTDIIQQTTRALQTDGAYRQTLRDRVVVEHDWQQISERLRQDLDGLTTG